MKTLARISLLTLGLAAAALPILAAADAPSTTAAQHPRVRALLAHRHAMRQHLAKKLDLSADQIAQLKAHRAKTVAAVKVIRADRNLSPDQKKTQVRDALKTARHDLFGVLTPDQQTKFREMQARFRARG